MFVDAHSHLAMPAFEHDLEEVLTRARDAGVHRLMTCATSLEDSESNVEIVRAHPDHGLVASAGFHPHEAHRWGNTSESRLREMIDRYPEITAIGEVGLDFHYNYSPPEIQCEVLRQQIRLARTVKLPLIIHCRDARRELRRILVEEKAHEVGGMLHCFTEDTSFAHFCLEQGLFVSISGIITFKKSETIREAVRHVPLDRLLIETDSPYLAPTPHRGRRNEPAFVIEVARFIADLKQVTVDDLASRTRKNFEILFDHSRST